MQLAFVITAHLPYLRRVGPSPFGEDMLHTMIAQSLTPLLNVLSDLAAARIKPRLALAISPILIEQLADPTVQKHFVIWMEEWLASYERDLDRAIVQKDDHRAYLARFYIEWGQGILRSFVERYDRNIPAALRDLCTRGIVEPLAGTATHAYLPLLGREESVRAQIEHGTLHIMRQLGRPQGLWLPGCGWRPGLEQIIADTDLRYAIVDPSSLPPGESASARWLIPYRLTGLFCAEDISHYIWSSRLGYAGDPIYRDSAVSDGYHAIGIDGPTSYDPYHAFRRAQEHTVHFVTLLVAQSEQRSDQTLALIPLDAHILGQRWFEGVAWMQGVLTLGATHPKLTLTTPGEYLRHNSPKAQASLQPSSWGDGGDHRAWQGYRAKEYWQALHLAEERLITAVRQRPNARGELERLLNQAARELLLAQSSDWPELLSAETNSEAVHAYWATYLDRCHQLCDHAFRPALDNATLILLEELEELDGPFPHLNYRVFQSDA